VIDKITFKKLCQPRIIQYFTVYADFLHQVGDNGAAWRRWLAHCICTKK